MHFGFALDLSDIDLLNADLLDQRYQERYTHLDFFVSKTSWRCLQDMSSRRLQDMSSGHLQDMSSRRLEDQQMFAGLFSVGYSEKDIQDIQDTEAVLRRCS